MMINPYSFLFITYLVSSIPFGLLLAKVFGNKDIREHGSKNIGATNVTRVLGKKLGFVTLILDALKGAVMVILAKKIFGLADVNNVVLLTALVAVIGHIFPIYLRFKGGKGVATTIAVILAINPILGIATIIFWLLIFWFSRISALSSIFSILLTTSFAFGSNIAIKEVILYLALWILIVIRHKENIIRLKNGTEKQIK